MMESPAQRGRRVVDFTRLVMPPIKHRQFRIFYDGQTPIAFVSWALLSTEAEQRYLADPHCLQPDDWASGTATYIVDFVATTNALRKITSHLRRDPLISFAPVRALKVRNAARTIVEIFADERGRHIKASRIA
jgi:cytolysin-activating lysine-acyltransferase